MDRHEYEALRNGEIGAPSLNLTILGEDERTLALGFNGPDRAVWHCYVHGSRIHVAVLDHAGVLLEHHHDTSLPCRLLRPADGRVYPERTDYRFAALMAASGLPLPLDSYRQRDRDSEVLFGGPVVDLAPRRIGDLEASLDGHAAGAATSAGEADGTVGRPESEAKRGVLGDLVATPEEALVPSTRRPLRRFGISRG